MERLRRPLETMSVRLFIAAREIYGPNANVIICPFIVTAGATMLYYAADPNSPTRRQLEKILQYDTNHGRAESADVLMAFREAIMHLNKEAQVIGEKKEESAAAKEFRLLLGNRLFIQSGTQIKREFLDKIHKFLKIEAEFNDFAGNPTEALKRVHDWVTMGEKDSFNAELPLDLIDPAYFGARMVYANAAHFRGGWMIPFNRELTDWETFFLDDGTTKEVEMMHMTDQFPYGEDTVRGFKFVEIPYNHNDASMVITISTKTRRFDEFVESVKNHFTDLNMQKRMRTVKLSIPRFTIQSTYNFKTLLSHAGIKDVGDDTGKFSNMTTEEGFRFSEGFHKTSIQVNEHGTFTMDKEFPPLPPPDLQSIPVRKTAEDALTIKKGLRGKMQQFSLSRKGPAEEEVAINPKLGEIIANVPFLVGVRHNRSSMYLFSGCVMSP